LLIVPKKKKLTDSIHDQEICGTSIFRYRPGGALHSELNKKDLVLFLSSSPNDAKPCSVSSAAMKGKIAATIACLVLLLLSLGG